MPIWLLNSQIIPPFAQYKPWVTKGGRLHIPLQCPRATHSPYVHCLPHSIMQSVLIQAEKTADEESPVRKVIFSPTGLAFYCFIHAIANLLFRVLEGSQDPEFLPSDPICLNLDLGSKVEQYRQWSAGSNPRHRKRRIGFYLVSGAGKPLQVPLCSDMHYVACLAFVCTT